MSTKILNGLDLGNQRITSLADPSASTDAVTKQYADAAIKGIQWKNAVAAATTTNITLTGEQTIDGVTTSASRVLVKNQTTGSGNGIYVTGSGAWVRATDFDESTEVTNGAAVSIEGGTINGGKVYQLTTTGTITVGTTSQTWSLLGGSGATYTAGTGISISAGTISATGPQKYAANVPAGSTTATVTHGLGTTDVTVSVYDITATPVLVLCDVTVTSTNVVTLGFATAPTTGQYRVVVVG